MKCECLSCGDVWEGAELDHRCMPGHAQAPELRIRIASLEQERDELRQRVEQFDAGRTMSEAKACGCVFDRYASKVEPCAAHADWLRREMDGESAS